MTLSTPIYVVTERGETLQLPVGRKLRPIRSNAKSCPGTVTAVAMIPKPWDEFHEELVYVDANLMGFGHAVCGTCQGTKKTPDGKSTCQACRGTGKASGA